MRAVIMAAGITGLVLLALFLFMLAKYIMIVLLVFAVAYFLVRIYNWCFSSTREHSSCTTEDDWSELLRQLQEDYSKNARQK